eukprot:Transcript_3504.p2 GENE.Transcript_3504~~Transcript_3504.p2  ORF type:complete len:103 (+),score=3.98 Transcript_3504:119-427(+)
MLIIYRVEYPGGDGAFTHVRHAPRQLEPLNSVAVGMEHVHACSGDIGSEQPAVGRCQSLSLAKKAEPLALRAKLTDVAAIESKDLDAPVERVGHQKRVVVHG